MKSGRILSLIVAVILIVSTLCVVGLMSVTAAETEITSAEEFKAMTDGNYKLMADIDLTTVEFTTIASFTGTIDGNCKTVTTSAPLFDSLAGEVKNLTIAGTINDTASTSAIGALANTAGTLTVTGVTNKASVTATAAKATGGFVGEVLGTNAVTITDSVNDGAITASGVVSGVGGFVGVVLGSGKTAHASVTIASSVNNGEISNPSGSGSSYSATNDYYWGAGGFVGAGDKYTIDISYSVNNGNVTSQGLAMSGFFGTALKWEKDKDNSRDNLSIRYSVNYGDITTNHAGAQGAAGFAGRLNRGKNMTYTFEYCYNVGAISGGQRVGGIFGYTNNSSGIKLTVKGCYNVGTLTADSYRFQTGSTGAYTGSTASNNFYIGSQKTNENYPKATSCADQTALNTALVALGEYIVDPDKNDGYAILKWQCTHSDGTNCLGKCFVCGEEVGEVKAHVWGEFVETVPPSVTTDGEETGTCSVCGETETRISTPASGKITPVDGVYNVSSENELLWLSYNMNAGIVPSNAQIAIKADITLQNGMTFISKKFTGTFDGENHTISGLTYAIFNRIGGVFKNVTLKGDIVSTDNTRMASVALESEAGGTTISGVHSFVNMNISGKYDTFAGLIAYCVGENLIENSSYSGKITVTGGAAYVAGIVAYSNRASYKKGGTVDNCVFDGEIELVGNCTGAKVGGIFGSHNANNGHDTVKNCLVSGTITVSEETTVDSLGGIVASYRSTGHTSAIKNCTFNGAIIGSGRFGAIAGNLSSRTTVSGCVAFTTDYEICPSIADGAVIKSSCTAAEIQAIGGVFELGGVKYQRYNFGYFNVDESKVADAGLFTENRFDAYLSMKDNGNKHNVKIVLLANMEAISDLTTTSIIVSFTKNGNTVKDVTLVLGGDDNVFRAYVAGLAAGEPYFAQDGCQFYSAVIEDLSDNSWDTVYVEIESGGETFFFGEASYAQ